MNDPIAITKTTSYEPYFGDFTGTLSTYTSAATKLRYTFKAPCPRVEKGRAYMVEIAPEQHTIRLIPVVM